VRGVGPTLLPYKRAAPLVRQRALAPAP